MSKSLSGAPKRVGAGLLAGVLAVFGLALASPAGAVEDVETVRLAGATRYGTAAAIAGEDPPGSFAGADTAILATGENFPDALAASGLTGANAPSPILLTRTAFLSEEALAALDELGVANVIVVGGTAAVSEDVVGSLTAEGYNVERVAGVDRYETAAEIAGEVGTPADIDGLATAIIATGTNYPDALAGGPLAYVGPNPILLVTPDSIPAATEAALADVEQVIILGGTAAVSSTVESELEDITGNDAVRLAGVNRFGTAEAIGDYVIDEVGFDGAEIILASGLNFPDALAGGPLGGELEAPIILTGSCPSADWLNGRSDTIETHWALGGTAAQTEASLDECEAASEDVEDDPVDTNAVFPASATTTQVLDPNENNPTVTEITFSGLTPGVDYDVYLFPCLEDDFGAQVFTDGVPLVGPDGSSRLNGVVTFHDETGGTGGQPNDIADFAGTSNSNELEISLVGSTPNGGQTAFDVEAPPNGSLRITLEGDGDVDCGIPVILEDALDDHTDTFQLGDKNEDTLENTDTPTNKFGVGPAVVAFEGLVENADEPDSNVDFVGAASMFTTGMGTGDDVGVVIHDHGDDLFGVDFDADNFFYNGDDFEGPITRAQAREYLTIGDNFGTCDGESACNSVDTPYTATGTNNFLFDGTDELPSPPTGVVATVSNSDGDATAVVDDVTLSWTAPNFASLGGDVDYYCVEFFNVNAADSGSVDDDCTDEVDSQQTGDAPTTMGCTATECDLEDAPQGTYRARVYAVSEAEDDSGWSWWSEPFNVLGGQDTTKPTITDIHVSSDVGAVGVLDTDDDIRAILSETMAGTIDDVGQFLDATDGDGTHWRITCETTATAPDDGGDVDCALNTVAVVVNGTPYPAGRVLTIEVGTVGAGVTQLNAGTLAGMQQPATVVAVSTGWDDLAGNQLDLPGSPDKTISA